MKTGKLFIQPDDTVALAFAAPFLMRAASAVLALVILLGPSITVSLYGVTFEIMDFFVSRADRAPVFVYWEVHCTVWVVMVCFVSALFLEHRELHVFFHAVFFTVEIVIQTAVSCVCYRVFRISAVLPVEFFHQRRKTVYIRSILLPIKNSDIFVTDSKLNVVPRKKLVIAL